MTPRRMANVVRSLTAEPQLDAMNLEACRERQESRQKETPSLATGGLGYA
jgi:hypothetical protein